MNVLFSSWGITATSEGDLGGKIDLIEERTIKNSGRGRPGPEPKIPMGLSAD